MTPGLLGCVRVGGPVESTDKTYLRGWRVEFSWWGVCVAGLGRGASVIPRDGGWAFRKQLEVGEQGGQA